MKDINMKCSGCGITTEEHEIATNPDGSMMKNICKICANQVK
ncbi:hypothetical protein [Spiroplasma endosymbiont of Nebria brevicollis]